MKTKYVDRNEAGHLLAERLRRELPTENLTVIALPRGGLQIAEPIAEKLGVPIGTLVVRKLGAPGQPELALGAIASGGFIYLNQDLVEKLGVSQEELLRIRDRESRELLRRELKYGIAQSENSLSGKRVLVVDDGIATGATMEVAIRALKASQVEALYVAVPVAALSAVEHLHKFVDHIYALQTPSLLGAIGEFYENFPPVTDEQVIRILEQYREKEASLDK